MDHSPLPQDELLPDSVPVTMPELPVQLRIESTQQLKALGDPLRRRILTTIQHQPATAKQIASRLQIAPGTIGHHLQVLESAELVQVVAHRLVHGIVARYYTRSARTFIYDTSLDTFSNHSMYLDFLTAAREDLAETLDAAGDPTPLIKVGYPRACISPERMQHYKERLEALATDFMREPVDPEGQVYGLCVTLFKSPPYQQTHHTTMADTPHAEE